MGVIRFPFFFLKLESDPPSQNRMADIYLSFSRNLPQPSGPSWVNKEQLHEDGRQFLQCPCMHLPAPTGPESLPSWFCSLFFQELKTLFSSGSLQLGLPSPSTSFPCQCQAVQHPCHQSQASQPKKTARVVQHDLLHCPNLLSYTSLCNPQAWVKISVFQPSQTVMPLPVFPHLYVFPFLFGFKRVFSQHFTSILELLQWIPFSDWLLNAITQLHWRTLKERKHRSASKAKSAGQRSKS